MTERRDAGDFLDVDAGLGDEERAVRDTVRDFARAELAPHVGEWYEKGTLPDDLGRASRPKAITELSSRMMPADGARLGRKLPVAGWLSDASLQFR